jgi:hypothetical protein
MMGQRHRVVVVTIRIRVRQRYRKDVHEVHLNEIGESLIRQAA